MLEQLPYLPDARKRSGDLEKLWQGPKIKPDEDPIELSLMEGKGLGERVVWMGGERRKKRGEKTVEQDCGGG
jgi:hypothetical protein